ncbi:NifU family protein [Paenibacillus brevis]|uniref:NifU family protein n=1 Tax=Paenibacillus brevis TaxID=2841508 RepID=A0ABS6FSZ7_9BACL|nr:NifU family protein [Paenibacillus brevis]MBU5673143.1 NifU family protein [Paenibacillus brevis]
MEENQILFDEVSEVLFKLRPFLLRDGGDAELIEVAGGIAKLRFLGACNGCPSATITLKAAIERAVLDEIESIKEVIQVF